MRSAARTSNHVLVMIALAVGLAGSIAFIRSNREGHDGTGGGAVDQEGLLRSRLTAARPGDTVVVPAGIYHFDSPVTLNTDGVTIRGAGRDKTVFDFSAAQSGDGVHARASDFTIEDLTIQDTRGDALRIDEGENIVIRNVRARWTEGPQPHVGAFGLRPSQVTNLLVEDNEVSGASTAGILVVQSRNAVVRHNRVSNNLVGIEIENGVGVDVTDNEATQNVGGMVVFNMPNLQVPGRGIRVFSNHVFANNTANFAPPGSAAASVPSGSGIIVNSVPQVEIFDNDLADNNTANIILASFYSIANIPKTGIGSAYDPYPSAIYIYGNRFKGGGAAPDGVMMQALRNLVYGQDGRFPDILWDGYANPADLDADGKLSAERAICIDNGDATLLNADGPGNYKNPNIQKDNFECTLPKLPPVRLYGRLGETPKRS
jgi:parallel beta-helix repeat protein